MEENKKSRWHSKKEKLKKSNSRKCHNICIINKWNIALLFYCRLSCSRTSQKNHSRI